MTSVLVRFKELQKYLILSFIFAGGVAYCCSILIDIFNLKIYYSGPVVVNIWTLLLFPAIDISIDTAIYGSSPTLHNELQIRVVRNMMHRSDRECLKTDIRFD